MTSDEFASELEALARSLEAAVPLCTTRVEHVRVSAHAARARRLADALTVQETAHVRSQG